MSNQNEIDAILAEAERTVGASGSTASERSSNSTPAAQATEEPPPLPKSPPPPPKRPPPSPQDIRRILSLDLPVIVRLAHRKMRVKEIMKLASGSIIEFDKAADAELDLMINNEIIGYGQAVKVGENFGLRVLNILSLQEKIEALGHAFR